MKVMEIILSGDDDILSKTGWFDLPSLDKDSQPTTTGSTDKTGTALANYKSSANAVNPNDIKKYLLSKGFDNNQAAGWLVNIKWESGFKPGAYVKSDAGQGQSGGFFGFHDKVNGNGLFTQMVNATGGGNKWQTDWQGQLDFAMRDSRGAEYKRTKFSSPGEAASWWVTHYEKPANTSQQAAIRAKSASQYA